MKEIVKVLLQEGIDEEVIHEVLNILEVSKDYLEGKKEHAKDEANRCLVNSVIKGSEKGDQVAQKHYRDLFDKSLERIKKYNAKVKDYLKKKENKDGQ